MNKDKIVEIIRNTVSMKASELDIIVSVNATIAEKNLKDQFQI